MPSILIVSHNNLALTKAAVRTALDQTVEPEVLVIDNASTDATIHWLMSKDHPRLLSIAYSSQRSLSECWNRGLKYLSRLDSGPILVINNDVELRPDTYEMLNWASSLSHSWFITAVSVNSRNQLGTSGDRSPSVLAQGARPHPDFSCFLIHPEVVDKVGWFDTDYYPAWCEDCDYHVRMHRAGIKAVCVDLPFYHHAASTMKNTPEGSRGSLHKGFERSRELFRSKYGCLPGTPGYEELFNESNLG